MADRIIVMNDGAIEQSGTPYEIYDHPATPFAANFIGTMNFYQTEGETRAIRPENIEITDRQSPYDLTARVKALEFKGPLTRVYGILPDANATGDGEICIDIPSETAAQLRLRENAVAFLRFPKERLIKYTAAV
jgi:iron(III) transport system ATP-binding protein